MNYDADGGRRCLLARPLLGRAGGRAEIPSGVFFLFRGRKLFELQEEVNTFGIFLSHARKFLARNCRRPFSLRSQSSNSAAAAATCCSGRESIPNGGHANQSSFQSTWRQVALTGGKWERSESERERKKTVLARSLTRQILLSLSADGSNKRRSFAALKFGHRPQRESKGRPAGGGCKLGLELHCTDAD